MEGDWIKVNIKNMHIEIVFWCEEDARKRISADVSGKGIIKDHEETILCG